MAIILYATRNTSSSHNFKQIYKFNNHNIKNKQNLLPKTQKSKENNCFSVSSKFCKNIA